MRTDMINEYINELVLAGGGVGLSFLARKATNAVRHI